MTRRPSMKVKRKPRSRLAHHRGPHKRRRHRRLLPAVPREHREHAVEEIRKRFGEHANGMLLVARYGTVLALRYDRMLGLITWLFDLREAVADLEWPRQWNLGGMRLGKSSDAVPVGEIAMLARRVQAIVQASAALANTLRTFRDEYEAAEQLRDVDVMMGNAVVRYATSKGLSIRARDLADFAVAVGIECPSDDAKTSWDRWSKRMSRLQLKGIKMTYHDPAGQPFDEDKFFGPYEQAAETTERDPG